MTGYVSHIHIEYGSYGYGFINGDDGNSYYFNNKSIDDDNIFIDSFYEDDEVEFKPALTYDGQKRAYHVVLKENTYAQKEADKEAIASKEEKSRDVQNRSASKQPEEIIDYSQFYYPGYSQYFDKESIFKNHLKDGSREEEVIDRLSSVFYISSVSSHLLNSRSKYEFCVAGVTQALKQFIRGKYEFLIVLSSFGNHDWQAQTLKAEREIRKRKEVADRRLLVNFYILISNADTFISEINKIKGSATAAIIPFTFEEILNIPLSGLSDLVIDRFSEYYFENNMLGETNAIDDDNLLFGDRGKIADSIVQRCVEGKNSGIFGLRRSGKSSVLNAVLRRLDRNEIKYIKIESNTIQFESWKLALYDIAKKIREEALGTTIQDGESEADYENRLKLRHNEADYQKRASICFVDDVQLYTKSDNGNPFVVAIDEIENITYNTASSSDWTNIEAFIGFWGALRDCKCPLIVCGVNSSINETNTISFNGHQGTNPMYGRIIADFSDTYLPAFTDEQTKEMINTLGGYSNIAFSNVYAEINKEFGGQPFPVRQFCSYVFENVKKYRTNGRIYEVTKATTDNLLKKFSKSNEGNRLAEVILEHLKIFSDEYDLLKKMVLSPDKYSTVENKDLYLIDHLQKYGLIEYDPNTHYVTVKLNLIKDYISRTAHKDPMDMDNTERRQYIQDKVYDIEVSLKKYILNYYSYGGNAQQFRNFLINKMGNKSYITQKDRTVDAQTCALKEFFDHHKFVIYFSSLSNIITNRWGELGTKIQEAGIDKEEFKVYMRKLNAGRIDADHYDAEDKKAPNDWDINDNVMRDFMNATQVMNRFLETLPQ